MKINRLTASALTAASVVLSLAAAGTAALAQGAAPGLRSVHDAKLGDYITDANGRALYIFTGDQQGRGANPSASKCADACAKAWPPYVVSENPEIRSQAQSNRVGTMAREGQKQVTYDGWPLYYFAEDAGANETKGQKVKAFGGDWWLIAPRGAKVGEQGLQPDLADH